MFLRQLTPPPYKQSLLRNVYTKEKYFKFFLEKNIQLINRGFTLEK